MSGHAFCFEIEVVFSLLARGKSLGSSFCARARSSALSPFHLNFPPFFFLFRTGPPVFDRFRSHFSLHGALTPFFFSRVPPGDAQRFIFLSIRPSPDPLRNAVLPLRILQVFPHTPILFPFIVPNEILPFLVAGLSPTKE